MNLRTYKNLMKLAYYWKLCNDLLTHSFCMDEPTGEDYEDYANENIAIGAARIAFSVKIDSDKPLSIRNVAAYLSESFGIDDLMVTFDDLNTSGDAWLVAFIGEGDVTVTKGELRYTHPRLAISVKPTDLELRNIVSCMVYSIFDGEVHSHYEVVDFLLYDLKRNIETHRGCSVREMVNQILNDGVL